MKIIIYYVKWKCSYSENFTLENNADYVIKCKKLKYGPQKHNN